jgi:broad specificity phosphatase PhoE
MLVRHGQSTANRDGIMQGQYDAPLSELGRRQATVVGSWCRARSIAWDARYCSPLSRASETAAIITRVAGQPGAVEDPDVSEVHAGSMQGKTAETLRKLYPEYYQRSIDDLGDYSQYGGESYDQVQRRVERFLERLVQRHRESEARVLVVSHGGLLFQLTKRLISLPVPRISLLRFSNCSVTCLDLRERRGTYLGEVQWHLPVDLMGGETSGGAANLLY